MATSSISPSFGATGARELLCNPLGTRGVRSMIPPLVDLPQLILAMVLRDHDVFGWTVAFFKESMRRDDMTGMRTVFALRHKLTSIQVTRRSLRRREENELTSPVRTESRADNVHAVSTTQLTALRRIVYHLPGQKIRRVEPQVERRI